MKYTVINNRIYYKLGTKIYDNNNYYEHTIDELIKLSMGQIVWKTVDRATHIELAKTQKDKGSTVIARKMLLNFLINNPNDLKGIGMVYPMLSSLYRKIGKPMKAIEIAEKYLNSYSLCNHACLTSIAAAYIDIGELSLARRYANKAKSLSYYNTSQELINLYARLNREEEKQKDQPRKLSRADLFIDILEKE